MKNEGVCIEAWLTDSKLPWVLNVEDRGPLVFPVKDAEATEGM